MSEEERKAIEFVKYYMRTYFFEEIAIQDDFDFEDSIKTALNLIEKQQKEIEKKDKIIDELEDIFYNYQLCEYEITDYTYRKCEYIGDDETPPCKDCIKNYFENQVKEVE